MLRLAPGLIPALLGALIALSACAPKVGEQVTEADLQRLEQRVRDRWAMLIAKDFGGLYEYTTPEYRRVFTKAMFVKKFSYMVDWELTSVEVLHYDSDAAVASVAVRVMSEPAKHTTTASKALGAVPITIRENWIFADGEWWHSANF